MLRTLVVKNESPAEDWRTIPRKEYKLATTHPLFRRKIREVSCEEDEENSFYTGILNTIADHCVGSVPLILGNHPVAEANDVVEDRWLEWATNNSIGSAIRQIRRGAARTGLGIGIPYSVDPTPENPVGFKIRTVSSLRLTNPLGTRIEDRIFDGIQYDKNWDIQKIFLKDARSIEPVEYDIKDILLWFKSTSEDMQIGLPECGPAFCLFPSVRRIMKAIVRGEEFKSCIPMAITLDKDMYRVEDTLDVPTDKFEYEPGFVPTLPPGTELTGLNVSSQAQDRTTFIHLVIAAAARCVSMPRNLALGDSSNSNMATAAIDIQPWIGRVKIDRNDFEPVIRKVFRMWYDRAVLVSRYLPIQARNDFTYDINYDATFEHPDPSKRANARNVDLASGSTTLYKVYTDQGLNPRRQLDREARTLGISRQELNELIMAKRGGIPSIVEGNVDDNQQQQNE